MLISSIFETLFNTKRRVGVVALALFLLVMPKCSLSQTDTLGTAEHSPGKALLLSAVLPGAGQVYNRQVWKVPIVYAALGVVGYLTYNNFTQMKYYRDEYLYRVDNNNQTQYPDNPDMVATPTSNIYNLYEAYNQTFQLSVIVAAAIYGLNLLDAYIYGHLFDFQITDDLTLNMSPTLMPTGNFAHTSNLWNMPVFTPAASITLRF